MRRRRTPQHRRGLPRRDALGPPGLPEQTGPVIQSTFDQLKADSGADVADLRAAVDPDGTSAIRTKPIKDAINAAAESEYGADNSLWPQPVSNILARLATRDANFNDLQNMRSATLRALQGGSPLGRDLNLDAVRRATVGAIEDQINQTAASGQGFTPDQLAAWNDFRAAARAHGARFGDDVGVDLSSKTYGRPDVGQATVPGRYFTPGAGGADSMGEFNNTFRDPATGALQPAAAEAMRQHVAGELGRLFGPDGTVSPQTLTQFQKNYGPALRQMPDLFNQVRDVDSAARLVQDTGAATAQSAADRNKSVLGLWLGRDTDTEMARVLQPGAGAQRMAQLVSLVKDSPDALQGLKRAFLDEWGKASATNTPSGAEGQPGIAYGGAEKFWNNNQGAAKVLFKPEELTRLQAVRDDLWSAARYRGMGGGPAGSPTQSYQTTAQMLRDAVTGADQINQFLPRPFADMFKGMMKARTDRALAPTTWRWTRRGRRC